MNSLLVEKFILEAGFKIVSKGDAESIFVIESESDAIKNLIVGVAPPIIIFEQYLFTLSKESKDVFKSLLIKNRDIVHGAFALTGDGSKVIFRYTLQLENLNQNEFEAAINSLSLLLSEYADQLIRFAKQ